MGAEEIPDVRVSDDEAASVAPEPSATARLYEALEISGERVERLREIGGGDLEIDVSFVALGGDLRVKATVRMARKPPKSTLASLEVKSVRPWLVRIDADLLERLARPAIMAAERALRWQANVAPVETEPREVLPAPRVAAAHAALASPGFIAVRARPDSDFADVVAAVALVNALPKDDFPQRRRRPISRLWILEERRLHAENDRRAERGERRRRITASEQRSYERARRAEIREAQRRGYLDARQQLTPAGLELIHVLALVEYHERET